LKQAARRIKKGDVYYVNLDPTFGHEQKGTRPVLVIQNDIANAMLSTVLVAPLTSNLKASGLPSTVTIKAGEAGLSEDSVILLFQIRTLDKRRLGRRIGPLEAKMMVKVDAAIRLSFDV